MCLPAVDERLSVPDALRRFRLQAVEQRLADRSIRRRKKLATDKPTERLTRALRRIYLREKVRVLDLLRAAELPYTGRVKEHAVTGYEELFSYLLNGVDYTPYEAALLDNYRDIFPFAMSDVVRQAARGVGVVGNLMDFPRAQTWMKDHTIQFSKTWAPTVTATTNEAIRNALAEGWKNFESTDQLIGRVKDVYTVAGDVRAEMIARTESSRAYNTASIEMGRELGAKEKFWVLSGSPYSYVDVCAENDAMNNIPIGEKFRDSKGRPIDGPPAHPNCLCDVGYEFPENWELPEEWS